ncbi:eCIS core domain-containing protein [Streptomyces sp. NBC_01420]|uniref:eCIS core domain-containing protein n=1 Tax=Streptomyces sp. NBC_01420 TaxID=2903858 RepID=UPI00386B26FF
MGRPPVRSGETTVNAQDHDDDHQHEHHTPPLETGDGHERLSGGHLHGDTAEAPATSDTHDAPHHLFRAAATGRTDVVGTAGMGVLQRTVGNAALGPVIQRARAAAPEQGEETESRSPVHDVISSGGGTPLDTETRTDLEGRMGADFSDVRIHNDSAAHESAKGVGAHAYTVGNNVVFQRDAYDPSSPQGRTTLAHELTHVIQQRNGPVEGTEAPGGIRVSDPSDRFEREAVANADRVLSDPAPAAPAAPTAAAPASAPAVQRAATEDEDEQPADVQGSFVQRAEEKDPEEEEEAPPA